MIHGRPIMSDEISAVAQSACKFSRDGNVQLSIMMLALIAAAKLLKVSRSQMVHEITRQWDGVEPLKAHTHTIGAKN